MTTLEDSGAALASTPAPPDADALIEEARRLRRRRYLRVGTALVVVAAAIGVGVALSQGGSGGRSGHHVRPHSTTPRFAAPPPTPRPPGVALPASGLFTQISVTSSGLLLNGETPATASSRDPTCVAAAVDPATLKVGTLRTGACGDPLLYGRTVEAVDTPTPFTYNATLSINTANPITGQVGNGPVVMTHGEYSNTHPVIAYGSRWLWIYDAATTAGPELLQVSSQSGQLTRTIPMPKLSRPLLAADDNGVWIANSLDGTPAAALSYLGSGASSPDTVLANPNLPICWLTAAGTTAWVGAAAVPSGGCVKETIEKFTDNDPTPIFSSTGAFAPFTVIGDETVGLWTMQWSPSDPSREQIIHVDPDTGSEAVVATLPSVVLPNYETDEGLAVGEGVYFDGSLYLLEPPYRVDAYLGYSSIVRVSDP